MTMPEASIDLDYSFIAGEDNVRPTGEVFVMKAITVPFSMQCLSNEKLWLGVLAMDRRHDLASFLR